MYTVVHAWSDRAGNEPHQAGLTRADEAYRTLKTRVLEGDLLAAETAFSSHLEGSIAVVEARSSQALARMVGLGRAKPAETSGS